MNYTAEHIDVEKFEEVLEECLDHVRSMFHCSNYESQKNKSTAYQEGADNVFYEICKELDINCPEARDMKLSIDEKAALLADKIKAIYNAE